MIIPLLLVAVDVRAGMMVVCVLFLLCQQNDVVEGFGQKKWWIGIDGVHLLCILGDANCC